MDRVQRVLDFDRFSTYPRCKPRTRTKARPGLDLFSDVWSGTEWHAEEPQKPRKSTRTLPTAPFKVLDAPGLRDDFYCSVLAYDHNCNTLAVGLGNLLYGWSESTGVTLLNAGLKDGSWLTTVAFSSRQGNQSILAFGRSNGRFSLMSLFDSLVPRFEMQGAAPVACLGWRPVSTMRPSLNPYAPGRIVPTEDLVVGDEMGDVYYYSVEWPQHWEVARDSWPGSVTLLARVKVHCQQICGLAWAPKGDMFATGGNDNLCCLFLISKVLERANGSTGKGARHWPAGSETHQWQHGAAVKAIAFCPWRESLLATGGGSNDKCIHFFHTTSGAALAKIAVAAQVTSLVWSTTRREIAATFGYANPDHPYRIAVFSWPECQQVAAVPWEGEHRALYAIGYPGGPNDIYQTKERRRSRTAVEGCIVVAGSDESVKFHEVWTAGRKATTGLDCGVLGGSDILEMSEGIDKEGDLIR